MKRRRAVAAMAAYYVVTGSWPLLHMPSFEFISGPKLEHWLVRTVGALAVANGLALAAGAERAQPSEETVALAVLSATAFAVVDVTYVARRRIRPVYLADALLQLAFIAAICADPAEQG